MIRRAFTWLVFLFIMFLLAVFLYAIQPPTPRPTQIPQTPTKSLVIQQTPTTAPSTPTPLVVSPTPSVILSEAEESHSTSPDFYTVQSGDTLNAIALKYGFDTEDLVRANHLRDPNRIYAGQQLLLARVPITVPEATILKGKQIIVVLSTQRAYAYEDGVLVHPDFIIASGVAAFPTVPGRYAIYVKYEKTDMSGPGYYIKDVPWTMYFYKGYGLHGAPWNHNLGTPGSHGCVNMDPEEAHWLFDWAPLGTPVLVLP